MGTKVDTAFRAGLQNGLGRAIVHLCETGGGPRYREAILWACTHDLTYDRQCESGREVYLADLIAATGEQEFYRRWLFHATEATRIHGRGGEQLLALLRVFAERGDEAARARLYAIHATNGSTARPDGAAELVELDGLDGLLVAAPNLDITPDDIWFTRYLIAESSGRDSEAATWTALETLAEREPTVARLLAQMRADEATEQARQERLEAEQWPADYLTIRAWLRAGESRAVAALGRWARNATEDELVPLANDLLAERNQKLQTDFLRIFFRRRFPLDHTPLLTWARDPSPRIAHAARRALALIEAEGVRALGLDLLAEGNGDGARLLVANYRPGDYALLERLLLTWTARDELHALGFGLRDLASAHLTEEARGALLALYERGPCSLCRDDAVESLMALGPLPAWLATECRWDANPTIRKLVGA